MGRALPLKFLKGRRTEIHQWFLKQYATSRHSNVVSHLNHDALSSQKMSEYSRKVVIQYSVFVS